MYGLKWKRKYENDTLDGTKWVLNFKSDTKKMNCFGSNVFPIEFDHFAKFLRKITSKHKISDDLLRNF
jgi:hypothetical protein